VEIVYDATVAFCARFIDRRSRAHDQMVQAARSGKQGGFTERLFRARSQARDEKRRQ
jgi:hypothetical protein